MLWILIFALLPTRGEAKHELTLGSCSPSLWYVGIQLCAWHISFQFQSWAPLTKILDPLLLAHAQVNTLKASYFLLKKLPETTSLL